MKHSIVYHNRGYLVKQYTNLFNTSSYREKKQQEQQQRRTTMKRHSDSNVYRTLKASRNGK